MMLTTERTFPRVMLLTTHWDVRVGHSCRHKARDQDSVM